MCVNSKYVFLEKIVGSRTNYELEVAKVEVNDLATAINLYKRSITFYELYNAGQTSDCIDERADSVNLIIYSLVTMESIIYTDLKLMRGGE